MVADDTTYGKHVRHIPEYTISMLQLTYCSDPATSVSLDDLRKFLEQRGYLTIATVDDDGWPRTARFEYGQYEDGLTLICDIITDSQTCRNLLRDQRAHIEIGSQDDEYTLQCRASVTPLSGNELQAAQRDYFAKSQRLGRNDTAERFESRPDITWFSLKPFDLLYTDVSHRPEWLRVRYAEA